MKKLRVGKSITGKSATGKNPFASSVSIEDVVSRIVQQLIGLRKEWKR
jgi:hypothetical protein